MFFFFFPFPNKSFLVTYYLVDIIVQSLFWGIRQESREEQTLTASEQVSNQLLVPHKKPFPLTACSPIRNPWVASQEDSIHLLELLGLKGHM